MIVSGNADAIYSIMVDDAISKECVLLCQPWSPYSISVPLAKALISRQPTQFSSRGIEILLDLAKATPGLLSVYIGYLVHIHSYDHKPLNSNGAAWISDVSPDDATQPDSMSSKESPACPLAHFASHFCTQAIVEQTSWCSIFTSQVAGCTTKPNYMQVLMELSLLHAKGNAFS